MGHPTQSPLPSQADPFASLDGEIVGTRTGSHQGDSVGWDMYTKVRPEVD